MIYLITERYRLAWLNLINANCFHLKPICIRPGGTILKVGGCGRGSAGPCTYEIHLGLNEIYLQCLNYKLSHWAKSPKKHSVGVFLTIWHCSAKLTKTHSFRLFFWLFCPQGTNMYPTKVRFCLCHQINFIDDKLDCDSTWEKVQGRTNK